MKMRPTIREALWFGNQRGLGLKFGGGAGGDGKGWERERNVCTRSPCSRVCVEGGVVVVVVVVVEL